MSNLADLPDRGSHLKEFPALGIHDYREVFFKPYRIIYRISGEFAYFFLIADGRRNMKTLLQRRLLLSKT